jgi:hypothetical protein
LRREVKVTKRQDASRCVVNEAAHSRKEAALYFGPVKSREGVVVVFRQAVSPYRRFVCRVIDTPPLPRSRIWGIYHYAQLRDELYLW